MAERLDLAVIESRWWDTSNDSVRGLFDTLAGIHVDNPFGYHYEMFSNAASLQEVIPRVASQKDIHNLYIGAHGNEKHLKGAGRNKISRTVLWNALKEIPPRRLYGLFLGSCKFGVNAEDLARNSHLTWVAGYTKKIDWMQSSMVDLYFWNAYFSSEVAGETNREDRAARMLNLLACLHQRVPSAFFELGLQVTLEYKGAYITVSNEFWGDEDNRDVLDDADSWMAKHKPGKWP